MKKLIILYLLFAYSTSIFCDNIVNIDSNTGTLTLNFNQIDEEAKNEIFAKLLSKDLYRLSKYYSDRNSDFELLLLDSAIILDIDNIQAKNAKILLGFKLQENKEIKKNMLDNVISDIFGSKQPLMAEYDENALRYQYVLLDNIKPYFTNDSNEYKSIVSSLIQIEGILERITLNEIGNNKIYESLSSIADAHYRKKDYISAISYYSSLYFNFNDNYALTQITKCIEIIESQQ